MTAVGTLRTRFEALEALLLPPVFPATMTEIHDALHALEEAIHWHSCTGDGRTEDATVEAQLGDWTQRVRDAVYYARAHARSKGYALGVHGTLRRDVDVVAVPWTEDACDPDELVASIADNFISLGLSYAGGKTHMVQSREVKPFGRLAYALPLKGIPAPYLDISVSPRGTGDGREAERKGDGYYSFEDYERDFENDADIWYVRFTDSECPVLFTPRHYGGDESEQMLRMLAALLNASKAGYAPASIPPQPWDWRTPNHPNKEALKGTQPQKLERDAAPAVTRDWRTDDTVKVMRNLIATQMGHEHLADHHDLLDELCDAVAKCRRQP